MAVGVGNPWHVFNDDSFIKACISSADNGDTDLTVEFDVVRGFSYTIIVIMIITCCCGKMYENRDVTAVNALLCCFGCALV